MRQLLNVCLFITLILCATTAEAQKFGKVSDEEWGATPPEQYTDANVVVLSDKGTMEVSLDGVVCTRHRRLKIFNQAGAEEAGDIEIYYSEGEKIANFKAHTILPGGKKKKVKKTYTKTYGSRKAKTFAFPAIEDGCIVEYKYKTKGGSLGALDPWYFSSEYYTLNSQFTLKLGEGFTYSQVYNNIPAQVRVPVKDEDKVDNIRIFTWNMSDIMPVRPEPYMSALKDYSSAMHFQLVSYNSPTYHYSFIKGWTDLGQQVQDYLKEWRRGSAKLQALTDEVTGGATSKYDKAKAVYQFVCSNIRSSSEDGWISHGSIADVIDEGIATNDEKNLVFVELARLAGMNAWPVMISTRDHAKFNPKIYQLSQFNRCIALVETDEGVVFVDALTKFCPFGVLPPDCNTTGGFLLDGKDSRLIKITAQEPKTYRLDATTIALDSVGLARCSTSVYLYGYYTASYGSAFEREDPVEAARDYFLENLELEYDLDTVCIEAPEDQNACVVTLTYTLKNFAQELDKNLIFVPPIFSFKNNPFDDDERHFPIDFGFPFTRHSKITIAFPDSLSGEQLAADTSFAIDGGSYVRVSERSGNVVTFESKLTVTKPSFSPQLYEGVRGFFQSVADASCDECAVIR